MADFIPRQGDPLPPTMRTRWMDLGDGTHARVVGVVQAGLLINGVLRQWPIDATGPLRVIDNRLTFTGTTLQVIDPRLVFDSTDGALIVDSSPQIDVHEGRAFEAAYMSPHGSEIANDGSILFLLQVGATKQMHWTAELSSGGDSELKITRNPTVTNVGTALTAFNMNDASPNTATVVATHTPTVTGGTGTVMLNDFIGGGSGPRATGGDSAPGLERIGARNTNYLIELINRSGGAQMMSIHAQWYEVIP